MKDELNEQPDTSEVSEQEPGTVVDAEFPDVEEAAPNTPGPELRRVRITIDALWDGKEVLRSMIPDENSFINWHSRIGTLTHDEVKGYSISTWMTTDLFRVEDLPEPEPEQPYEIIHKTSTFHQVRVCVESGSGIYRNGAQERTVWVIDAQDGTHALFVATSAMKRTDLYRRQPVYMGDTTGFTVDTVRLISLMETPAPEIKQEDYIVIAKEVRA